MFQACTHLINPTCAYHVPLRSVGVAPRITAPAGGHVAVSAVSDGRGRFPGLIEGITLQTQRLWPRGAAPRRAVCRSSCNPHSFARNRVGPLSSKALAAATHARTRSVHALTCRTLLPTTLANTDATCSRCLTLRGEGTRRVTTIPEISPLAQSFPSVVRLQCSDLTRYLSNT